MNPGRGDIERIVDAAIDGTAITVLDVFTDALARMIAATPYTMPSYRRGLVDARELALHLRDHVAEG